nr:MAG TPA: hypothetical protein [Caudoviricetes sp.]
MTAPLRGGSFFMLGGKTFLKKALWGIDIRGVK